MTFLSPFSLHFPGRDLPENLFYFTLHFPGRDLPDILISFFSSFSRKRFAALAYVFSFLCLYFTGINLAESRMLSTCCCIWRSFCPSRPSQFIRRRRRKHSVVTTTHLERQATLYCSNTVFSSKSN